MNDRLTENLDDQVWYAIKLIKEHEYTDGEHHKQWVLNQVLLLLTGGAEHLEDEGTIP